MLDFRIIGISPFCNPDPNLVAALAKTDALGVLDLGTDAAAGAAGLDALLARNPRRFGALVRPGLQPADLPPEVLVILPGPPYRVHEWAPRRVLAQVTSVEEARQAIAAGAAGLIAKGTESGGRVGEDTSFLLLQHLVRETELPIWVQGGIGLHTAAACVAGGAYGVVLDSQLALARESRLPADVKSAVAMMDGSETTLIGSHRVFTRPDLSALLAMDPEHVAEHLGANGLTIQPLPAGQDTALAGMLAQRFVTAGGIVAGIERSIDASIQTAKRLDPLAPGSALAAQHHMQYPVLQGPMTRVSDTAEFANAVSAAGGLPFVALSMLRGKASQKLLRETKALLGSRIWGVGVLGFVDAELRAEQLAAIEEVAPPVALIAGGRPSQARPLEDKGIAAYLHVPSPGLLKLFLADGARRFIFEGRECGGHVGPRTSFVLWELQLAELMKFDRPQELSVVFAGGIHDARSAAMVATMAAPLAAKGAKIGILMGTAYLFTQEAVTSGAILPTYQSAALDCRHTVLLETAPGHATRCVDSPYVRAFLTERQRLAAAGTDPKKIWEELERLNLGRLRIASKGIKREGSKLVDVGEDEQLEEGMYMIGDVATLHHELTTAEALHREVTAGASAYLAKLQVAAKPVEKPAPADIAIVGMACVFPGADDLEGFWSNVVAGTYSITEVDPARWSPDLYYDPNSRNGEKTPNKTGGFIGDVLFDPLDYGIPPQSLAAVDPSQLLSLEVARRALADAGYATRDFDRSQVSVIFGAESGADISAAYGFRALYPQLAGALPAALDEHLPRLTEDSFPGVLANVIAGRIANRLDLGGSNFTVDAACASSLAALYLGARELTMGTSDMVLCGGVDLHNGINDYLLFAGVHALSASGRSRPFDAKGDGIVLGEGVACVVLKRLADAERDGDRIYAVVKSVAGSSDGRSLGLTAPRKEGQMRAVERAYARAGISPVDVGLVEAHGTGTVVGDRTELGTLTDTFLAAGAGVGRCGLSSVKSQIGHTKCAAGLASVIKVAKALYHRVLPPSINIDQPNPAYDPQTSPFVLSGKARPWVDTGTYAGVSAFGFGGSNFHTVLASYDDADAPEHGFSHWPFELFLFRAADRGAALEHARALLGVLEAGVPVHLRDLAASVSLHGQGPAQLALVAGTPEELRTALQAALVGRADGKDVLFPHKLEGKIAFLFPGQGSQRPNMLREIFLAFPHLRRLLELGLPWRDALFPPTPWSEQQRAAQNAAITDTRVAQPTLGMAGLAMADLLGKAGVRADMAAGHSYGELVALCLAGAFGESELLELSLERADAILEAAEGTSSGMAAVAADAATVEAALKGIKGVVAANHNAPDQTVISGPQEALDEALKRLDKAGVSARLIPVAAAFHSPLVAGASQRLRAHLEHLPIADLALPVWSNTTAEPYPVTAPAIRDRLAEHVAKPVYFSKEIEAMYAAGARIFVEAGPGRVLTGLVGRILGNREHVTIACDSGQGSEIHDLLVALGRLAMLGVDVDARFLFAGRDARQLDLHHPQKLAPSRTAWKINGWLARPVYGDPPKNRLRPTPHPVISPGQQAPVLPAAALDQREATVVEYLRNLRELAVAQRDVMLGLLGAEASPSIRLIEPAHPALADQRPRPATPAEAPAAAPASQRTAPVAAAPRVDIQAALLAIVSDKTGYPEEMLGLDLDLEAELSIDSIKRVEILGALAGQIGLDETAGADRDYIIEQLAAKKTLREIIDWMKEQETNAPDLVVPATIAAAAAPVPAVAATPAAVSVDIPAALLAIVSDKTGYPQEMLGLDLDLEAELSIDSIKRVEILGALAGQIGLDETAGADRDYIIEQLAAKKTLREIIDWLKQQADEQPPAQAIAAPAAAPAVSLPAAPAVVPPAASVAPTQAPTTLTSTDIQVALLSIVSDKTGYPQDMLGLDLDLEAELSIDSIKRVEILGALAGQIGLDESAGADRDYIIEQLAAKKTLREIIDWIGDQQTGQATSPAPASPQAPAARVGPPVRRFVPQVTPIEQARTRPEMLAGKKFALSDADSAIGKQLGVLLKKQGATVELLHHGGAVGEVDGVVYLGALRDPNGIYPAKELFDLARQAVLNGAQWIYGLTGLGGRFGRYGDSPFPTASGGIAGLLKSLAKEKPELRVRVIDVSLGESPKKVALAVFNELTAQDERVEVGYAGGERFALRTVQANIDGAATAELDLGPDSLVLITGGARGITAGAAIELARRAACKLALVGRSPLPGPEEPVYAPATDMAVLRQILITQGKLKSPRDIEAECLRVMAARDVRNTLAAVREAGSELEYHSLDVRDAVAFEQLIDDLYARHGRIDGVIHGAGVIEDKLILDKPRDSFDRVFDTKVQAARSLAAKLREDVKFVVFFSSVSGAFGNRGQTDYAAAGDLLDKLALELHKRIPGRVVSIDWGPWASTGMVSDQLARAYARQGVGLIPVDEGIQRLFQELQSGPASDAQVILMAAEPSVMA